MFFFLSFSRCGNDKRVSMQKRYWWLAIGQLVFLVSFGWTGELAPNLTDKITSVNPRQLVQVWIKLPQVEDGLQLKASVNALATTRAGRYQAAITRLRKNNSDSQLELVEWLKVLEKDSRAANIKPHWIANIVEAEVAAGELAALANRNDIETIYAVPKIELIRPDKIGSAPALSTGVSDNLKFIKADSAWKAGYTGAGRVICSFDTGVDGMHPALFDSWKGHDGDSAAAWFDPSTRETFPHTFPPRPLFSPEHGTQTMGLLVGHNDNTGDTIGVALDARWISAAVIDIEGASIIDAFEWAADPDSDPNSIDDVPDVISHSWGVKDIDCMNVFYDIIDNLEALGIVNIFAAGNEGPSSYTIRNPANRANDPLDCFAVGNFDHATGSIATSSSRGPSDCNGATKPNVCSPGELVWTSRPGSSYGYFAGTSAATPHVAGLVALLRQKSPNATVDEIKQAILTTATDYGVSGPDNTYGWGVINCMAALNALSPINTAPNVRVYAFDHAPISPGDTVIGTVVLQNIGANVSGVSAMITGSNSSLTVLNNSAFFGPINEGDTVRSADIIRVIVSDTVTAGTILSLDFLITGSGGYSHLVKLHFLVEPRAQRLFVTHDANRIAFTISNFGTYGLGDNSFFPAGGSGFTLDSGANDLFEAGLLIGTDTSHVSDGVRNPFGEPDGDFGVLPGGNIELIEPGSIATQETYSRFSDERAENPIGVEIRQESYASDSTAYNDFIILRYILKNVNTLSISGVYVGLYCDWDIYYRKSNAGGWEPVGDFAWTAYNDGTSLSSFRGVKILQGIAGSAFTAESTLITYVLDGFTEQEKYDALTDGFSTANIYKTAQKDLNQVVSVGPISLMSGQVDTVAFAFLAGNSLAEISDAATRAMSFYSLVTAVDDEPQNLLPTEYTLSQNYPNPFNPRTTIEYGLPARAHVELAIYNLLGQKVRTLTDQVQKEGNHVAHWDGQDDYGDELASGVYLYRLRAGEVTLSRKMLLLK
jgi:subtilisin family serine protease